MEKIKDLQYYKENAEENYLTTPISVLRYITELEQALQLHKTQVNRCFSIGEKVIIERCIHGHDFEIGDEAEIVNYDRTETACWLCCNEKQQWWVSEDEVRLK